MIPDLNRIKVFYYVYKLMNFSAAAAELHITQSAVSQHVRNLEREIKARLFIRGRKRMVPTQAGEKVFALVQPFMDALEDQILNIRLAEEGVSGTLRIGAPVEFGEKYLPASISSFRSIYSGVDFYLELGHPSVLIPMASAGDLDFAFVDVFSDSAPFSSREFSGLHTIAVAVEELILICSDRFDKQVLNRSRSFEVLEACAYIAYRKHAPAIRSWFRHHFNKSAVHFCVSLTVESARAVISAVKEHMGLGVVPSHFVRPELESGELIHIKTGESEILNRISLIQLEDKVPGVIEKAFLDHFLKELKQKAPGLSL